jgi:hypothetical protein
MVPARRLDTLVMLQVVLAVGLLLVRVVLGRGQRVLLLKGLPVPGRPELRLVVLAAGMALQEEQVEGGLVLQGEQVVLVGGMVWAAVLVDGLAAQAAVPGEFPTGSALCPMQRRRTLPLDRQWCSSSSPSDRLSIVFGIQSTAFATAFGSMPLSRWWDIFCFLLRLRLDYGWVQYRAR